MLRKSTEVLKMGLKLSAVAALSLCLICVINVNSASAYGLDYEMDLARVEKTIEFYGEELREIVEQAIRNNDTHPDRKETAENSYRRQSFLNEVLPQKRSSAFSKDMLLQLRKTEHPRERLK